ncbi:MAG: pitrilysin family protein [Defluviicoccus sp.]|nr:pitrilysin family protein [Defluviicoccus sp.]MDE0384502.1 pitrilysin family protein [Defluviicoccus sp.]
MSVATTALSNGLRVVTHRMASVETVSLGAWINVGTRHERAEANGIAHLVEHMAFKGTSRRSARAIAEEIESVGGHLNAYTSRELTAFHATVLGGDEGLALDIIADILQHAVLDDEELERERAVILREIGQSTDTPEDVVFDDFQATAFPDQPVGRPTLGTPQLVGAIGRAALVDYIARFYTAGRIVVAAAGKVDHDEFARRVEDAFGGLRADAVSAPEPAVYTGGDSRAVRDLEQLHLVLGLQGIAHRDPDYYALAVFSAGLGGGLSSRLFQDIREERGLVYSIYSFNSSYADCGLFGIYAGTGAESASEVVERTCDNLRTMAGEVDEAELGRARAQLKAGILMSLESTASRAEQIARHMLIFGRVLATSEITDGVDAVDCAAVVRISDRLRAGRPTVAVLGPEAALPGYEEIASALS